MNIEDLTPNQLERLREAGQCLADSQSRVRLSDQELLDLIMMHLSKRRNVPYPRPDRSRVVLPASPPWDSRY